MVFGNTFFARRVDSRLTEMQSQYSEQLMKPFSRFCRECGFSYTTGWRFRRAGLVEVINLRGRPYILQTEVERFKARAAAGEFSRQSNLSASKAQ